MELGLTGLKDATRVWGIGQRGCLGPAGARVVAAGAGVGVGVGVGPSRSRSRSRSRSSSCSSSCSGR